MGRQGFVRKDRLLLLCDADNKVAVLFYRNLRNSYVSSHPETCVTLRVMQQICTSKMIINLSQSNNNLSQLSVTFPCIPILFSHIGRIMWYIRKHSMQNINAHWCQTLVMHTPIQPLVIRLSFPRLKMYVFMYVFHQSFRESANETNQDVWISLELLPYWNETVRWLWIPKLDKELLPFWRWYLGVAWPGIELVASRMQFIRVNTCPIEINWGTEGLKKENFIIQASRFVL
jgi:hypothetical protein